MQEQNEPGAVITPGAMATPVPQTATSESASLPPPAPLQPQSTAPSVSTDLPQAPIPAYSNAVTSTEAVLASNPTSPTQEYTDNDGLFMTWQTQESNEHDKQASWYAAVMVVALVLTVVVFFMTEKDVFVSVAVFLAVLGFAYLASHKPKQQQYALAQEGIYVGEKLRAYKEFKNFSEVQEATGPTIILIPHKRFVSPLVLKLTQDSVDEAVDTLAHFLPVEERKLDAVDQLMRRIRL